MKRVTVKSLEVSTDAKCDKLYPIDPNNLTPDLKTFGFKLNKDQALTLAKLLLLASEWENIDVTLFRKARKDGTHQITVTSTKK